MATTAGNPLVPLGTLNRILGAVQFVDNPQLNVTASFLGKGGLRISPEGATSVNIPTLTGAVPSGEPYQLMTVAIPLLKTQGLSDTYKKQIELNTAIGDFTIIPDAMPLSYYQITNASIIGYDGMAMDGSDPVFMVHVQGVYQCNSALWA
jgi:hypothetical protein